jgi:hypothetical protein
MPEPSPQTYETHVRRLPAPYLLVSAGIALHVVLAAGQLALQPSLRSLWQLAVAISLGGLVWIVRTNSLRVQDRIIRLEERVRLHRLLPEELRARIDDLTLGQLVALRFASDQELAELVQSVLAEGLTDRDAIKRRVRDWRPDHLRV